MSIHFSPVSSCTIKIHSIREAYIIRSAISLSKTFKLIRPWIFRFIVFFGRKFRIHHFKFNIKSLTRLCSHVKRLPFISSTISITPLISIIYGTILCLMFLSKHCSSFLKSYTSHVIKSCICFLSAGVRHTPNIKFIIRIRLITTQFI